MRTHIAIPSNRSHQLLKSLTFSKRDSCLALQSMLDEKNLEGLYKEHYGYLCTIASKYTFSDNDAEELVQDFFFDFWSKRQGTSLSGIGNLKAYLATSIRRRALNYLRKIANERKRDDEFSQVIDINREQNDLYDFELLQKEIDDAIGELPPKCEEIFKLSRFQGLTYKQISTQLYVSVKTVESQMGIALKRLRKSWRII